jgi:hypothetical protein
MCVCVCVEGMSVCVWRGMVMKAGRKFLYLIQGCWVGGLGLGGECVKVRVRV